MGVHDGHRDRLRARFLEYGLDNFNDLNALELLLFYAIPRRDTNEIAHALLECFGSLEGVFYASERELLQVPGIGTNAAALIRLVPQLMKKSALSRPDRREVIMNSSDAGRYFVPRFMYEQDEVVYLLCLDGQKRVIKCAEMGRGVVNCVETSIRRIVETALKYKSSSVILAHNHPDGLALPSSEDDMVTKQVSTALALVGVSLEDHIIVAGDDFVSFADSGIMRLYRY
ncbi:MAG: DNA repair protein RadC [Firmicutes bacterium]|nr:DNA repair protein RadC [Oscillospiraceae bacterium]MBS5433164.1 DNA repair protein RadC [Bacillota bacterium]